jgi:hypothetical protein
MCSIFTFLCVYDIRLTSYHKRVGGGNVYYFLWNGRYKRALLSQYLYVERKVGENENK